MKILLLLILIVNSCGIIKRPSKSNSNSCVELIDDNNPKNIEVREAKNKNAANRLAAVAKNHLTLYSNSAKLRAQIDGAGKVLAATYFASGDVSSEGESFNKSEKIITPISGLRVFFGEFSIDYYESSPRQIWVDNKDGTLRLIDEKLNYTDSTSVRYCGTKPAESGDDYQLPDYVLPKNTKLSATFTIEYDATDINVTYAN